MQNINDALEARIEQELDFEKLNELCEHITDAVREMLESCGLYFRIFSRVKSPESIAAKLKRGKYGTMENPKKIQDLLGMRVVLYYYDDLRICRDIMESTFKLLDGWSRSNYDVGEFKAAKINGVFQYPSEYFNTYKKEIWTLPIDITFEIQLRTMFFEGWHEIEHDMRYKSVLPDDEFWQGSEELSRILNCILANLELNDWSLVQLFEQLAYNHYKNGNWELMLKNHFRIKIDDKERLNEEIIKIFDNDKKIAKQFFKCSRKSLIKELLKLDKPNINYNLIVMLINNLFVHDACIAEICQKLNVPVEEHSFQKTILCRLETNTLFHLELPLMHRATRKTESEFNTAAAIIFKWARFKMNPVFENIPSEICTYQSALAGYQIKIEYKPEILQFDMQMNYIDSKLIGTIWHVHTSIALKADGLLHFYHMTSRDMPRGATERSTFLKPSFMPDLSNKVGLTDIVRLGSRAIFVANNEEYDKFNELILNPDRALPVIAIAQKQSANTVTMDTAEFKDGYDMNTFTINGTRLAKVIGHYSHVYMLDYTVVNRLSKDNAINPKDANGCICIFWPQASQKTPVLFTQEMVYDTRFDFNRFAFHDENIYEKAFRHKLVQIIKDDNVSH